jgi:starch synthase
VAVSLNVLFAIAELAPLIKVGGIGDVGGSLPRALRRLGFDVRVALPYYAAIDRQQVAAERLGSLPQGATIWQAEVRGVPVYLIEHEAFGREEVYGYEDDPARFLAFCDALLASTDALAWRPDLLHLHDWHPGFIATRLTDRPEHPWANLPSISTIHNLAFTGPFDAAFAREHGLAGEALASPDGLGPELPYSALAQAILHADLVSTVSPTYAKEILTEPFDGALAPLLQRLGDRLSGILNGIDAEEYDPAQDPHLAARFDAEHLDRRIENKRALQRQLSLPLEDDVPLVGMVSRLFWQKGPDLAVTAIERLLSTHRSDDRPQTGARPGPPGRLQFVALGKGDEEHERPLAELAVRHPQQVAVRIDFDPPLGQLIYGGCDLFLMPSRYEPCGLGQLIAMRYGAIPVVRRTGGLADSVEPFNATRGLGTGFIFDQESPAAICSALEEAFAVYEDATAWRELQARCMSQDFSWNSSARQYSKFYERALAFRSRAATSKEARDE